MAKPVRFPGQTHEFGAPKCMDDDECGALPAALAEIEGHPTYISCWKLSKEELEEIAKTGVLWVGVVSMQPPLIVSVTKPFASPMNHHSN